MSGIELGAYTYSIVGQRLDIRLTIGSYTTVYPRHSILTVIYLENNRITLKLLDGSHVTILMPTKGDTEEPDLRFSPKLRRIYGEICDLFLT